MSENLDYLNRPRNRTRVGEYLRFVGRYWLDRATELSQPKLGEHVEIAQPSYLKPTGLVRIIPNPENQVTDERTKAPVAIGESQPVVQLEPANPERHLRIVR